MLQLRIRFSVSQLLVFVAWCGVGAFFTSKLGYAGAVLWIYATIISIVGIWISPKARIWLFSLSVFFAIYPFFGGSGALRFELFGVEYKGWDTEFFGDRLILAVATIPCDILAMGSRRLNEAIFWHHGIHVRRIAMIWCWLLTALGFQLSTLFRAAPKRQAEDDAKS